MQKVTSSKMRDGIGITCITTEKFKSAVLRVCFLLPLGGEGAACQSVLPFVLRRGTSRLLDMTAIGAELDALYGARIEPMVRREGETLAVGFVADVIDETYARNGDQLTEKVIALLMELLYSPYLFEGAFCPDYTASEVSNVLDRIAAQKNNPRSYAPQRLIEEMCRDEAFGSPSWGSEEAVRAVTAQSLYAAYTHMLQNARMELFYCGSMQPEAVSALFEAHLQDTVPQNVYEPYTEILAMPKGAPREARETLPVAQGKLSMGFRTGGNSLISGDSMAYWVFSVLYGGSMTAKLFLSVRETLSLCYYASAQFVSQKGIMMVNSGIENENFAVARDEILRQLDLCKAGEITMDEIGAAQKALTGAWKSVLDDPLQLEHYWLVQRIAGILQSPEERLSEVQKVTYDRVVRAAQQTTLDTVYFLEGDAT